MKKLLEAELMSIAHRILKLKGREDVHALHKEAQLVTQKLSVLKFYEDYKHMIKEEMPQADFDAHLMSYTNDIKNEDDAKLSLNALEKTVEKETIETNILENQIEEEIESKLLNEDLSHEKLPEDEEEFLVLNDGLTAEEVTEDEENESELIDNSLSQEINESIDDESIINENKPEALTIKPENELFSSDEIEIKADTFHEILESKEDLIINEQSHHIQKELNEQEEIVAINSEKKLEDLFQDFTDFDFVKVETEKKPIENEEQFEEQAVINENIESSLEEIENPIKIEEEIIDFSNAFVQNTPEITENKVFSLNDKLIGGVKIGLNDKIGFVKHLFDGSDEDFTRVISQLNTFNTYQEAIDFIENFVKPDYNNWENKDDYASRFFGILERSY